MKVILILELHIIWSTKEIKSYLIFFIIYKFIVYRYIMNSNKPKLNFSKPLKSSISANAVNTSGLSIVFYSLLMLLAGFIILLLIFLVQYLRTPCGAEGKKNYWSYLGGFDLSNPCNLPIPEKKYEEREVKDEREVFHISDQIYTQEEALAKCQAYGGELASYQQIVDYYNAGGSFQTYGWSKDGSAYYPIQPCDYIKLRRQGVNVGPPGVNGGKFDHSFRLGANCFGVKPVGKTQCLKPPICDEFGKTELCQRNPDACKVLDTDRVDGYTSKQWSRFDDGPDQSCSAV
jgi:hypothetical protein